MAVEYYVQHLAHYNFLLFYKPEVFFDETYQYDNRIYVEFNYLYHWHQFMPETFNVDGTVYSIDDCMYTTEPVLKHGIRAFVDAMSKSLGGQVRSIHREIESMNAGCDGHSLSSKLTVSAPFAGRFSPLWDHLNFTQSKSWGYCYEL